MRITIGRAVAAAVTAAMAMGGNASADTMTLEVWGAHKARGGTLPGDPVATAERYSANLSPFYYVGANRQLYEFETSHNALGGILPGRPAPAMIRGAYYRGEDGRLYRAGANFGGAHTDLGGQLAGDPASSSFFAFYKGMDGHLYAVDPDRRHIDLGGTVTGPITAYTAPDGITHVFHSQDGPIRHVTFATSPHTQPCEGTTLRRRSSPIMPEPAQLGSTCYEDNHIATARGHGKWVSETLGGDVRGRIAVAASGEPYYSILSVFYRGGNRRLYMLRGPSQAGQWSGHRSLGGDLPSDPVAVARWDPRWDGPVIKRVDVFYRGGNRRLYKVTCRASCTRHSDLGGKLFGDPAVQVIWAGGSAYRFRVAYTGANRRLYTLDGRTDE